MKRAVVDSAKPRDFTPRHRLESGIRLPWRSIAADSTNANGDSSGSPAKEQGSSARIELLAPTYAANLAKVSTSGEFMKQVFATFALCMPVLAQSGELSISCIGAETNSCPVAVDVTLDRERLIAKFSQKDSSGNHAIGILGWCGDAISGHGRWDSDGGCGTTGKFRVLNGELTKQQLADGTMQFEIHTIMAMCSSSNSERCSVVPRPALRQPTQ